MRLIDADEVLKKMDMLTENKDSMSDFYSGLDTGRELITNAIEERAGMKIEDCKRLLDDLAEQMDYLAMALTNQQLKDADLSSTTSSKDLNKGECQMNKMKPCPFCGGSVLMTSPSGKEYYLFCSKCKAETRQCKTLEEAIEAWNRRVEDTK